MYNKIKALSKCLSLFVFVWFQYAGSKKKAYDTLRSNVVIVVAFNSYNFIFSFLKSTLSAE